MTSRSRRNLRLFLASLRIIIAGPRVFALHRLHPGGNSTPGNRAVAHQVESAEQATLGTKSDGALPESKLRQRKIRAADLRGRGGIPRVVETPQGGILILGNIDLPRNVEIMDDISIQGSVEIGALSTLHGRVRATGDVEIGEGTLIEGEVFAGGDCRAARETTFGDVIQAYGNVELQEGCRVGLSVAARGRVTLTGNVTVLGRIEAGQGVEVISGTTVYTTRSLVEAAKSQKQVVEGLHAAAVGKGYLVQMMVEAGRTAEETGEIQLYLTDPSSDGKKILIPVLMQDAPVAAEKVSSLQALAEFVGADAVKIVSSSELDANARRLARFNHITVVEKPSKDQLEALIKDL